MPFANGQGYSDDILQNAACRLTDWGSQPLADGPSCFLDQSIQKVSVTLLTLHALCQLLPVSV
ncbi:hypothetical protein [Candidatus Methylobacter favarea]|uniref:hypothetical protein n=1 Tax=Candidatus Methylobacter favarea TaxID=2707345 RepID=UPI00157CAB54|nr:hypothetical protein [Candidatus Methylobacter favarea]